MNGVFLMFSRLSEILCVSSSQKKETWLWKSEVNKGLTCPHIFKGETWEFPTVVESLSATLEKVKGKDASEEGLVKQSFKHRI